VSDASKASEIFKVQQRHAQYTFSQCTPKNKHINLAERAKHNRR